MVGAINAVTIVVMVLLANLLFGQAKKTFPLVIHFQNQVGSRQLYLDSVYTNAYGETFTVRNFRYYLSHFSIAGPNGKRTTLPASYYLIDERKPESKTLTIQVPFSTVTAIHFEIGVDSAQNVSGVQTGALDPANGMFWTWNSGYIFAKLEGTSPQARAPQNGFTYHIGGFRTGENAIRKVILTLPVKFYPAKGASVTILADVNAWFSGVHPFKIADQASIMTPGPQAMQVADNYSKMFSIAPGR